MVDAIRFAAAVFDFPNVLQDKLETPFAYHILGLFVFSFRNSVFFSRRRYYATAAAGYRLFFFFIKIRIFFHR